ncbi:MAG TPA: ribbon-helix-helix domain-containing protein [Thermotoga sp.]|nr:ribbon-helix-helix domain-containing protein [Thermotoga sp.]
MVWSSVAVRHEIKEMIDEISKRRKVPKSRLVEEAIMMYIKEQKLKGKYHWGYDIDRNIWYGFKLVNSIAQLKLVIELAEQGVVEKEKVEEYRKMTENTIQQIEERLGINLNTLKRALRKFIEKPNGITKKELNDETKYLMAKIVLGEYKEEQKAEKEDQ